MLTMGGKDEREKRRTSESLQAMMLQKADVTALARLTGQDNNTAAKTLIDLSVDGNLIRKARGRFLKSSRLRAAERVLRERIDIQKPQ